MRVLKGLSNSNLAIPVNKIDWINWEEATGGKIMIKIGTGGVTHILESPDKKDGTKVYSTIIELIEEL